MIRAIADAMSYSQWKKRRPIHEEVEASRTPRLLDYKLDFSFHLYNQWRVCVNSRVCTQQTVAAKKVDVCLLGKTVNFGSVRQQLTM